MCYKYFKRPYFTRRLQLHLRIQLLLLHTTQKPSSSLLHDLSDCLITLPPVAVTHHHETLIIIVSSQTNGRSERLKSSSSTRTRRIIEVTACSPVNEIHIRVIKKWTWHNKKRGLKLCVCRRSWMIGRYYTLLPSTTVIKLQKKASINLLNIQKPHKDNNMNDNLYIW